MDSETMVYESIDAAQIACDENHSMAQYAVILAVTDGYTYRYFYATMDRTLFEYRKPKPKIVSQKVYVSDSEWIPREKLYPHENTDNS